MLIYTTDVVKKDDALDLFEQLHESVTGDIAYQNGDVWWQFRSKLLLLPGVKLHVAEEAEKEA